jgi:hypothetical protein
MNAYELAEFIENGGENIDRKELVKMLRQQADRIAELDKQVGIFDAELMKARISNSLMKADRDRLAKGHKELSDEEILNIARNLKESSEPYNINFARLIIKASRGEE